MPRLISALCAILLILPGAALGKNKLIEHLEPPFWWTGMAHPHLQLMVHGPGIGALTPALSYPGVRIDSVTRVANPNYLFINLTVAANARSGAFDIAFSGAGKRTTYRYELREREQGSAARAGFSGRDAIYQIMPDRFANANPANDNMPGMRELANRSSGGGRHGGDIEGIIHGLDYIAAMGFTQLWPTPLVENNMPAWSYHGYAATDHYRIDPRYGSNEDYVRLAREAKKRGIGIIQDVVLSHIGSSHWWMADLPTPDWIAYGGKFVPTRHHRVSVQDPYGATADKENFISGWFSATMPDMNQSNPLVATYLIQNNIWWIEYAGLSGLRIDTYSYSDGAFLTEYTRRLMAEYPGLNMVGEEWHKSPAVVSRWQRGKQNPDGYVSHLPSLMDFPLAEAMRGALASKDPAAFTEVYETLSQDYLYPNPLALVLFEGNHDVSRLYSVVGEDLDLYKMNLVFLMTMPRIPQFYYGTELLMTSTTGPRDDASYRHDFPGGWRGDAVNAFSGQGLSAAQRQAQDFVRKLANWRKGAAVIHHGRTMHFGAQDGTYVYFRYLDGQKVMVAFNKNSTSAVLPAGRFAEILGKAGSGVDVLTGQRYALDTALTLPPRSSVILEIQ
ncbi:glycoside hydrolase family 13 protein [Massilia sp. PAMC28688]|uniref:glycoside hydrolase family 13 protein n=1 Tax=Massilia sp. PAMC28688 TaxID=2861283 RepID=UPI001C635182|nr:glycoside hydrolase family 13 protein [Massilia sp. PAMC28688]QYF91848.1 glycoside hydrolase family 13 protein [Massilia sp. PAMC28688]